MIFTYYERVPEEESSATPTCIATLVVYGFWVVVCIATIVIRLFAISFLYRSYKVLLRKEHDKEKRKKHDFEKKRKARRLKKREMQRILTAKRNEFQILRNKISKSIREAAFTGGVDGTTV